MGIYDRDYMHDEPTGSKRKTGNIKNSKDFGWTRILALSAVSILLVFVTQKLLWPARDVDPSEHWVGDSKKSETQKYADPPKRDVNTVTFDQLVEIPYITQASARDLIHKRPFKKWEELDDVYGIGPKRLESLKQYLFIASTNSTSSHIDKNIETGEGSGL